MSIFGTILSKIFPSSHPAVAASSTPAAGTAAAAATPAATPTSTAPAPHVDVNAVLEGYASSNSQTLNWQTSIVDLLKLLNLDSSHESRLALAKELNFTGDTNDSASMNIWLHKAVMEKLEENGGTVPDALKH